MQGDGQHIRVVGAQLYQHGEIRDVIAVSPPEATLLAPEPSAFIHDGEVALMTVETGTAVKQVHEIATDMMFEDAKMSGIGTSRMIGSKALDGVVTFPMLHHETTHNLINSTS